MDERALLERVPDRLFIGGEWVAGANGTLKVYDPATGDPIREIANASVEDGARALDAAVGAADAWAATPPRTRAEILRRAFDLLQERRDDFALLMTTAASSCAGSPRKPCASPAATGRTPRAPVG